MLDVFALVVIVVHFGVPLLYYFYMKKKWLGRPWNLKFDKNYKPKVTIIIPTYNEAKLIEVKLDNIYAQEYPRDSLEVVIVDSASTDGTLDIVKKWISQHGDINIKIFEEPERRGMVPALNYVLQHCQINGEVVIFTDVDAFWEGDTLKRIVKYFADSSVGAVTAGIAPIATLAIDDPLERSYRNYFTQLRIAESKAHSTPIHNGALIALRTSLLYKIGGLPEYTGNNDSTPASIIAFMGYRAIHADDVVVKELIKEGQVLRKIRRAQHLILHFLKTKQYSKKLGFYSPAKQFQKIWQIEWWLHIINPWLLIVAIALLIVSTLHTSPVAPIILGIGLVLLISSTYRMWILQQLYLVIGAVRNLWTKELVWRK